MSITIYTYIIIFITAVFCYFLFKALTARDINNENLSEKIYNKKVFLTSNEYSFYTKMISLENELHIHIVPQVNLGTIIDKSYGYRNELNRNIDFGIFDSTYKNILLLIELNDNSHNNQNRKTRDKKVKEICKEAGIKLITFYTSKPNEIIYVKNRIKGELKY